MLIINGNLKLFNNENKHLSSCQQIKFVIIFKNKIIQCDVTILYIIKWQLKKYIYYYLSLSWSIIKQNYLNLYGYRKGRFLKINTK